MNMFTVSSFHTLFYTNLISRLCFSACLALILISKSTADDTPISDHRMEKTRKYPGSYQPDSQRNADELLTEIRALRVELRQTSEEQNSRLKRIENALKLPPSKEPAKAITPAAIAATPAAKPNPAEPSKSASKVSVCSQGCDFSDLQKAVNAVEPGGEVSVAPEINGTCAIIKKPVHLIGRTSKDGSRTHLPGGVCIGKAPLVTAAENIIIEGFEISGVAVGDGNGACIRLDPGTRDLKVRNIYCHDSQDGILGASEGHMLIEDSIFARNGFGNGQAHGIYIIGGDEVTIRRSQILSGQNAGHTLKSGARKLTVEDSILAALNGHNSRALDAYAGGEITLLRNVIQQGPNSDNSDVIGLALEAGRLLPNNHSFRMEGNWVVFDPDGRGVLLRGRKLGPINLQHNTFVGLKGSGMDDIQEADNQWLPNRKKAGLPEFDGTTSTLPKISAKK